MYCVKEGHSKSLQYLLNILQKQKTKLSTLKTQRIMLKLLSMSVAFHQELFKKGIMMNFLAKLSQRYEILMLQAKIRWFTALLRRALGSQTMLPTSPKSLISSLMRFRLIQAIFTSKNCILHPGCYQACLFHSSPAFAKCHNDMPRSMFAKLTVANAGSRVSWWRKIMDLALTSELLQTSAVHKRG